MREAQPHFGEITSKQPAQQAESAKRGFASESASKKADNTQAESAKRGFASESASKKAGDTQAESAKRGFAGRGNSRKLETGRPAVGGTLIHVIGACPVIKPAEAGDRRME